VAVAHAGWAGRGGSEISNGLQGISVIVLGRSGDAASSSPQEEIMIYSASNPGRLLVRPESMVRVVAGKGGKKRDGQAASGKECPVGTRGRITYLVLREWMWTTVQPLSGCNYRTSDV